MGYPEGIQRLKCLIGPVGGQLSRPEIDRPEIDRPEIDHPEIDPLDTPWNTVLAWS